MNTNIESIREQALTIIQQAELTDSERIVRLKNLCKLQENDYIVWFLLGSELAQQKSYDEALAAYTRSIELEQNFPIARFQLCLLALVVGRQETINQYLPYLIALPEVHYLHHFSKAIELVVKDDGAQAIASLKQGIEINNENEPLNADMHELISQINSQIENGTQSEELENDSQQAQTQHKISSSLLMDIYKQRK